MLMVEGDPRRESLTAIVRKDTYEYEEVRISRRSARTVAGCARRKNVVERPKDSENAAFLFDLGQAQDLPDLADGRQWEEALCRFVLIRSVRKIRRNDSRERDPCMRK
jgi:hypothetical protein